MKSRHGRAILAIMIAARHQGVNTYYKTLACFRIPAGGRRPLRGLHRRYGACQVWLTLRFWLWLFWRHGSVPPEAHVPSTTVWLLTQLFTLVMIFAPGGSIWLFMTLTGIIERIMNAISLERYPGRRVHRSGKMSRYADN